MFTENRGVGPTEPWTSGPLPYPPVSNRARVHELADDLSRIGHKPFALPVGIMLNEAPEHLSACIRCDTCDAFPCMVNAKVDAHVACVVPALKHDKVTLLTKAIVISSETTPNGHSVSSVLAERDGHRETCCADLVVVSCGAVNLAALLLRSANDRRPDGLANSSDMVCGRPSLHGPQQFSADGVLSLTQSRRVSKDNRPKRLLLRHR